MQEILGREEDILFDLEQIKLLTQTKDTLTDSDKERIKRLPIQKRKSEKEATLKEKEEKRKRFIRIWLVELEDKVKSSNLPPEIKAQILDMTSYAKNRNMTFMYSVEEKIDKLQTQIQEVQEKEKQKRQECEDLKKQSMAEKGVEGIVVENIATATVAEIGIEAYKKAHPEWYHVQYNNDPEKLKQMRLDHFEHKTLEKMAKMELPYEAEKTYPQKQGSQYTKAQKAAEVAEEKDLADFAYQQACQNAEQQHTEKPDKDGFMTNYWKKLAPPQKREIMAKFKTTQKGQEHEQAKQKADQLALKKGIERLRRKHAQKEAKKLKGLSKRLAKEQTPQKKTNHQLLKESSQMTKSEERVREKTQTMTKNTPQKPKTTTPDLARIALKKGLRQNIA